MRTVLLPAAAALVVLAGCGDDEREAGPRAALEDIAKGAGPCAELLVVGETIPQAVADVGCVDVDGMLLFPGFMDCADGRVFLSDTDRLGWGFVGEPLHEPAGADDPAFGEAFEACVGG